MEAAKENTIAKVVSDTESVFHICHAGETLLARKIESVVVEQVLNDITWQCMSTHTLLYRHVTVNSALCIVPVLGRKKPGRHCQNDNHNNNCYSHVYAEDCQKYFQS